MAYFNYESEDEFDTYVNEFIERGSLWLFRRVIRDFRNPFEKFSDNEFKIRYRFRKDTVLEVLLPIVNVALTKTNCRGLPIPPVYQLLVALRYYATGSFQIVSGDLIEISQPTVSRIVKKVSHLLCLKLKTYVKFPLPQNLNANKEHFHRIGSFPGVIACIDCTHIQIISPGGIFSEVFRNRKRYFSLNIQVVCGPNLEFYDIVADRPGSVHDSRIFDNSVLKARLEGGNLKDRGILLGDSGYGNASYLLTPFVNVQNSRERRYNCSHIKTRNTIERSIGVWKRIFPCLKAVNATKLTTTSRIIVATSILYNICRERQEFNDYDDSLATNEDGINHNPNSDNLDGLAFRNAFAERHFS